MPARRLVLASASPARLRLLRTAGFAPDVVVSGVHESGVETPDPWDVVRELAVRKARAVASRPEVADAVVVGCDSGLLFDGALHGKPVDAEDATARWHRLRGRSASLLTGHCVVDTRTGEEASDVCDTVVRFGFPSDAEIKLYLATGEPLRVAGAFTLDGYSAPFVDGVEGDPGNVIGLSLPTMRRLLGRIGVDVTALWA